ncbi:DNA recombination protein RmuC [Candidatus Nomurabacteria bacterium CG_4_10_14_0_2_um_filter_30_12]|uniref:DNA recombination protein RmuC n=1 Tax=Candidatus Nomurabacteria bacterium CG_4_10_14_0_2_um_filter_30_12 TaxID=1974727 RepID=A0A2J0MFB0_9BACT|nr:MAG: DNA recombination protein RmuC [Candidatus Nomurabacteria bacterium CG_4_10_14_0_2_um_filter_30_12]
MIITLLIVVVFLLLLNLYFLYQLNKKGQSSIFEELKDQLTSIETVLKDLKDEFPKNREEMGKNLKSAREEINNVLKNVSDTLTRSVTGIGQMQKNQLDTFSNQLTVLTKSNKEELDKMTKTIETKLKAIQDDNNIKLEKMRETVDEKLQTTLQQRLGESFKLVSGQLEEVHKGLGEMKSLATNVGDLKKVLSNVKTRGILGEIQLANILEEILTPDQYDKNVKTKKTSDAHVEFAIKLPGKDLSGEAVYLPLDSKFPLEDYQNLLTAYELGDTVKIEESSKLLETNIKKFAKDIHDKYIDVPYTTDFGIMFLPMEGLYAEIVKRTKLLETLQREYKIVVSGPTTLAAFLNSLQMGFRTLMIEKRSSEVWKVLGAVKTEFKSFESVLKKAQEKIRQADNEIDTLVGARTNQIRRKLKSVEELPVPQTQAMLNDVSPTVEVVEDTLIQ